MRLRARMRAFFPEPPSDMVEVTLESVCERFPAESCMPATRVAAAMPSRQFAGESVRGRRDWNARTRTNPASRPNAG
jgi:hypothetical protein